MIDIGGDNSNSPVDHHHRANPNLGEVGNQHHLRSLMLGRNRAQQKKMHDDEKPRDYCREVAVERIEIGQACQSANAERRKKLMGGVLLGAMLRVAAKADWYQCSVIYYQQLPAYASSTPRTPHSRPLSRAPPPPREVQRYRDQKISGINVTSPSRFLQMSHDKDARPLFICMETRDCASAFTCM